MRSGVIQIIQNSNLRHTGNGGFLWSLLTDSITNAYRFSFGSGNGEGVVYPSYSDPRHNAFPLRCMLEKPIVRGQALSLSSF